MQLNTLLTFALATIFSFLSLGLALPTGDDNLKAIDARQYMNYDWMLNCAPSGKSSVSAGECWRRFRTTCDGQGNMVSEWKGNGNICNKQTCSCVKRPGVSLPGFSDPSPEEIAWAANMGSFREAVDPKVSSAEVHTYTTASVKPASTEKARSVADADTDVIT